MQNIVVFGISGQAKVVVDIIEKEAKYNIAGMIAPDSNYDSHFFSYGILGQDEDLPRIVGEHDIFGGIIAIGDNWKRSGVYRKISRIVPEFNFVCAIHPSAQLARDVSIEKGTVVMAGVIINCGSKIGPFCILNTNSSLDHDSVMGEFSSLGPNSSTGGLVTLGPFSALCLGANVIHEIQIGAHTVIGAGAAVVRNIPAFTVASGVPAEVRRKREKGEEYL